MAIDKYYMERHISDLIHELESLKKDIEELLNDGEFYQTIDNADYKDGAIETADSIIKVIDKRIVRLKGLK